MRFVIITAVSLLMLISDAFAQSSSPSPMPGDRAAAAKRETQDLEMARSIEALRHLRMQAPSEEGQQLETSASAQSQL